MKSINFKDKIEKEIVETIQTNEGVHDAIKNVVKDRFVDKETFEQRWEKSQKRWEQNQKAINETLSKMKIVEITDEMLEDLFASTVGALEARWGMGPEKSFHNASIRIFKRNTDLKVMHVVEPDEDGIVFGRPEQIELDIVLKNGKFLIMEIKSSLSRADVILFAKKAEFYQERLNKKATALVMISPMIDENAQDYINHFGIIAYSFATEVDPVLLD